MKTRRTHSGYAAVLTEALRKRKPVFTDLYTEETQQNPHISVVAPIFTSDAQTAPPLGAIVLVNDATQFLYPMIQSWPMPSKTAETLLFKRDGDEVLFLNELLYKRDAALKLRIPLTRTNVPAVMGALGQRGLVQGLDYRGVPSVAVILPIPDSPWFMVAKDDASAVRADWRSRAVLILALFTALTAGLVAIGLIFWHRQQKAHYSMLYNAEARLRASMERHSITLKAVGDGIIAVDTKGQVELLNPIAETLTGWSHKEACGRPMEEVFHIINEKTREAAENPVTKVLRGEVVTGTTNQTLLISRNGIEWPITNSAAPIRDAQGKTSGVVLVFRDQTDERWTRRLIQVRLALLEYASNNSLEDLLTKALDEIGALVESPIGFYHFVDVDQKILHLQQWSTRTLKDFCRAEGRGMHYGVDQAGVWADCVREGKPVVHNDYASLPHKKGMPAGHAEVIRELVVPVLKAGKVVAILGVGNKPADYSEKDIEVVSYLADVTWQLIEHKHTEEVLRKSEMLFKDLFDRHSAVKLIIDKETGVIVDGNQAAEKYYGWSKSQLRQMKIEDINILSAEEVKQATKKATKLKRNSIEVQHRRSDGSIRDVAVFNSQITVNGKDLLHAIVHDITQEKKMRQALRRSEAQYHTLFDSLIEGFCTIEMVFDDNGRPVDYRFLEVNPAFEKQTGLRDAQGKLIRDLAPNNEKHWFDMYGKVALTGEPVQFKNEAKALGRYYDGCAYRLGGPESRKVAILFNDITDRELAVDALKKMNEILEVRVAERTETLKVSLDKLQAEIDHRKRTEMRLQETLKEVERSNQDLEQFAYVASHDLQEPLRMVSSYTQLLAQRYQDQLDDKANKFIGYAVDGAVRMQRLINDLLAYSRISTQGKRFDTVDSQAILNEVRHNLAAAIEDSHAQVLNDDLPAVQADNTQLSQLFQNLIGNAIKFRTADVPRIHVSAHDLGAEWCFSVKDNGIGIDEQYAEKVFVIFQRLHTRQEYAGTGIGLAVCKRIVERHGGRIWFESEPGKGTTFYFTVKKLEETAQ